MRKICFLMIVASALLFSSCKESKGDFSYRFDSTAKPGKENSIREMFGYNRYYSGVTFDEEKSNQKALAAFRALKSSILFANGNGKCIFFSGEYIEGNNLFSLESWYIVVPFMERTFIKSDATLRPEMRVIQRKFLKKTDFYGDIDFDPDIYQKRRSEHLHLVYGGRAMAKMQ